ncbi:hypothetical protein [Pedobacter soli]|uniref:Uncharacterized protein n=1 Tax=Pedobacter soli TaxID=390242 RepID=A0A1G6SVF4_9SPHI|nr:hypothetical protein [Pedobacter soli]SDD20701.1 hypothetical protein SAMN04488024_104375 [Pedobacter soli]
MESSNDSLCNSCYKPFTLTDTFCNNCGFPLQGTKEEKDSHIANRTIKEVDLIELQRSVDSACNSLYWIAGFIGLSTIFIFFTAAAEDQFALLIMNVILVGAFLGFGVLSRSKPTTAMISGLSLYVIIQILNLIADPATIFKGIIFKVGIIIYLIKGIKSVMEADKIKKELNIE